jgi:mRNA-degrading endonuclease RelE of RelBE toxin-antitoxin system
MTWAVKRTDTFLESLKVIRKNKEALLELDKKIKRLQEDPLHLGGWLSGELHGKKSTRISRKYRLIFTPDEMEQVFILTGLTIERVLTTNANPVFHCLNNPTQQPAEGGAVY